MPARRPRWTRARLARVLGERFGYTSRGGVNTAAVARGMGVSQRTVQRWLHADGRRRAPIPAARLDQLQQLLQLDPVHARRQRQQAAYAAAAIKQLTTDPGSALASWEKQGWLEEHLVSIVAVPGSRTCRVITSRTDADPFETRRGRGGRVVQQVRVATRFHAVVLADEVLRRVEPWRGNLPGGQHAPTITWFDDAPPVDLAGLVEKVSGMGEA